MGANGATLSLDKLDQLIDTVKGGKPHLLLMSRRSRRKLGALSRATGGGLLETDRNEFGMMVQFYDGVPIGINDYISEKQTVGTSTDCSTIYAVQLGEGGLVGLTAPGGLQVESVGSLETKDATRTRVKVVRIHCPVQHTEAGQADRSEGLGIGGSAWTCRQCGRGCVVTCTTRTQITTAGPTMSLTVTSSAP